MKRFFLLPLLLPAAALAQPVTDEINYHYLEVGYLFTELDVPGPNLDGRGPGRFEYSFGIRDHLHLFAGYAAVNYRDVDAKQRTKTVGIGTHFSLSDRFSIYGRLAYTDVDLDLGAGGMSDDGALATLGARFLPAAGYEVRASATHRELDNGGGDTMFNVAGDIWVTNVVALTFELGFGDDENIALVGGRFYIGGGGRTRGRW
jgi:hypothetical protein